MKVLSFNVRVWTRDLDSKSESYWKTRMKNIANYIIDNSPDIICFQELSYPATNFIPPNYKRINLTISHPIYIKDNYGFEIEKHKFKIHLDYVKLKKNKTYYHIINIHSHWNKKIIKNNCEQINEIVSNIPDSNRHKIIICGDWNNDYETLINKEISSDLFEKVKLMPTQGSSFRNFETNKQATIDFFALKNIQNTLIYNDNSALIYLNSNAFSDHSPLMLSF